MVKLRDRTPEARAARVQIARGIPLKTPGGKSIVLAVRGAPGTGVFRIERETGKLGGSTFVRDIEESGKQEVRIIGTLPSERGRFFRREEREQERELVGREVEFEAKRLERGLPQVPVERRGTAILLQERLAREEEPVKLRDTEFLVREIKPSGERGELLPRRALIGKVIITEPEPEKIQEQLLEPELVEPISRLQLFSPAARETLGLTETPEGLLEVRKGERKIIVTGRREPTIIPISAEFRTGFEGQLGTGKRIKFGIPTPSGIISFRTALDIVEKPLRPLAEKIFVGEKKEGIKIFEEQLLDIKRELRGRPKVTVIGSGLTLGEARTIQLRTGQFILGGELAVRKELAEKPIKAPALFGVFALAGGAFKFLPAKALAGKIVSVGSKVLGGAFVGAVGIETGLEIKRGDIAAAGGVVTKRSLEAVSIMGGFKTGVGVVGKGVTTFKRIRFERRIRIFEEKIPKFTPQELRARLGLGGIEIRQVRKFPKEIQTTFDVDSRVKTAEEALRLRIFEKAKTPLKRPQPPGRIAIIKTETKDILDIPPRILTLERVGRFDVSKFGKVPTEFTKIKLRLGRVGEIEISDPSIQKVLTKLKPKVGKFRILPEPPPKFITRVSKVTKFEGPPAKLGLDLETIGESQTRLQLIKQIEKFSGTPGRLTPQGFARQKGFIFIEPPSEPPIIDITRFGGIDIVPSRVVRPSKPIVSKLITPSTLVGLVGIASGIKSITGLGVGEDVGIISEQRLAGRLKIGLRSGQDLSSDLARIIGTESRVAIDVVSGIESIQDQIQVQEQEQLLITIPRFRVPERGLPGEPPPPGVPPQPPPTPPPPFLFPFFPKLLLGKARKRKLRPLPKEFAFTPDFIASVRREFAPQPRQRGFTGQERRFIPLTGKFVSPLKGAKEEGIIQLVARQLGG